MAKNDKIDKDIPKFNPKTEKLRNKTPEHVQVYSPDLDQNLYIYKPSLKQQLQMENVSKEDVKQQYVLDIIQMCTYDEDGEQLFWSTDEILEIKDINVLLPIIHAVQELGEKSKDQLEITEKNS